MQPAPPEFEELSAQLMSAAGQVAGEGRVARCLELAAAMPERWSKYFLFDPDFYTRNLVMRNELFELLVLCWQPGQVSPIHDHQGQRCWMGVLDGAVEETLYDFPRASSGACPRAVRTKRFSHGGVAFITDDIGLHDIRPMDQRRAVTIHLYSKPIRVARIFDPHSGQIHARQLAYHSIDGVAVAPSRI